MERKSFNSSVSFWLVFPLAAAVTWGAHEFGHFQMGRFLGYDMWFSMNKAGLIDPLSGYRSNLHGMLVGMAGPLVTYMQAGIAFALIVAKGRISQFAYPFLFLAFFMRLMAFGVSFLNPNDEAQTSLELGLPFWLLPAVAVGVLLALTIAGSRRQHVSWQTNALLYAAASVVATAVVFGDPLVGRLVG